MAEFTSYDVGVPAWVDLTTPDPSASRRFYGELFGWQFQVGPPETGHYTMATLRGKMVAAVAGEPAPERIPPAWTTYLAIDDVDRAARDVADAGGALLTGPMDVMQEGRMLVATDPTGAVFGLWQAGNHAGAQLANEPGTVTWNELVTPDLARVQEFFTKVAGYTWESMDTGASGPPYQVAKVAGQPVAGVMQLAQDVPAHWMTYFAVDDTEVTATRARELGATLLAGPQDSPFGRWATLRDPQGALLSVITVTNPS